MYPWHSSLNYLPLHSRTLPGSCSTRNLWKWHCNDKKSFFFWSNSKIKAYANIFEDVYTVISSGHQNNDGCISTADVCIFKWKYFPAAVRFRWKINVWRLFKRSIRFLLNSSYSWMFYTSIANWHSLYPLSHLLYISHYFNQNFLKSCHYSNFLYFLYLPKMSNNNINLCINVPSQDWPD